MREKAVLFGEERSLVGIVTDPDPVEEAHTPPAVIFLNAGILHHVGPNRLYVKLARQLARDGFVTLRFDFSGIGDSRVRSDNLPFGQSAIRETQEAMDFLQAEWGVQQFILTGICWGADHAFRVASADPRVSGVAPIDGYSFRTPGYHMRSYRRRLLRPRSWWNVFSGKTSLWANLRRSLRLQMAGPAQHADGQPDQDWKSPPGEKVVADVRALVERGVQVCLLYSSDDQAAYYNYLVRLERGLSPLRSTGKLRVELFQADHGFTLLSNQELLVCVMREWAQDVARSTGVAGTTRGLANGHERG